MIEAIAEIQTDAAEVAALKQQLAKTEDRLLNAGLSVDESTDQLITQKMKMGLSREDAVICARRQVLHDAVVKEHEAKVTAAIAAVDEQFKGKDKRLPEYKEARTAAISAAAAANGTTAKLIAAGAHQLNAQTN
jgi:hypothetical protein